MTEITQADRDAAEAYREKVLDAIWAGGPEDQVLLEAFARHRMEERAAIVAWLRAAGDEVVNWMAIQIEAGEHWK